MTEMQINDISLYNFRNYSFAEAEFDSGINIIYGLNGQGKTNLIEAVSYLSTGKAFRSRKDSVVIRFDCSEACIRGNVICDGDPAVIEAKLFSAPAKKQIFINGVKQKTLSPLAGKFGTVLFCPEDMYLAKDSPAARRAFIDYAIEQLRPGYSEALKQYRKLLEHKTRILRDRDEKPSLLDALDDFSIRMAQIGSVIISYRASYMQKLNVFAGRIHNQISGEQETLDIEYKTVSTIADPLKPPQELFPLLEEHYFMRKTAEIESRTCLSGPHKDDLEIKVAGKPVKNYGSQGQTRTAVLSMKLAERQMYKADTGVCPVLLLDDVLSELDRKRRDYVLSRIEEGQVFITCTEKPPSGDLIAGKTLSVEGGNITEG